MAERPLKIALVIGEASGDQLGAGLIDAIRRRRPDTAFVGLAGERMQAREPRSHARKAATNMARKAAQKKPKRQTGGSPG